MLDAAFYLRQIATWFSQVFSLVFSFFERIGFLNVVVACIFAMAVFRLIVYPLVGGASLNLGQDRADSAERPDRRVAFKTVTKNKDGSRTTTYNYRDDGD